ncbi:acyl-CoA dehydrogenase family protein [Amycolatopsis cihanbeyliensis]|uniref:Alkylation response protein AidB-like acyl-CoA dehydrogenase n=1 Tax=Amycolatopsis cihanbeyliensis TaxID=1128664 RepID=A0A542DFR9_AMYCI|nr:acyl-CoA dehydrogenase family protein [Amycolatopsis cihanbeyliensis]TQJ01938.1 alkylation response protein AidB-like acyl-CoA dehydrogenase [Amycolatopsis cihanbeyliensis]
MDFSFSEAQRELAALTRRILTDQVPPESLPGHGTGGFDRALWTELGKAGVIDAALPSAAGGGGFGLLEQCSILVELGRAAAPVPYLPAVTMAGSALAEFGDGELLERWLVPTLRGDRLLTAALPDLGTPCGFTAERAGSGWRVSGGQTAVPFAAFADGFLLPAGTADGEVLLLVERDRPGLSVLEQRVVDRGDAGLVEASDLDLPAGAALGEPGAGLVEWLRLRGTVGLVAAQFGVLERALELTAQYARERTQFDQVIGGFQAVRQRLADAYLDVQAVRLTLWQAAWCLAEGESADSTVATAKFWAAEAGHRVAHTAVHIHGGVGIDVDYPLHQYFVAAKRNEFALGGATAQLRALGDLLAEET